MFVGRTTELKKLNELYDSDRYECVIVYGRRRVGKTALIKEFIKNKKAIYFLAREATGEINLTGFSTDVFAVAEKERKGNSVFSDWENAFDYIYEISKDERLILVIDEYPYLAGGFRPISSIIQAHIDNQLKDSKLFLILCGSSMSFMEYQVLGYKSPLYGRRTAQFKMKPFSFFEALPFFGGFGKEEKAVLYGVTGGIPEYLVKINPAQTLRENIIDLFLTTSGHLYEEPTNLLKQELREPTVYNGLIEAIARGASRLNEIATKCGMESNKCAKYLNSLISLGIVKKELPVTETLSKKSIYLLDDMMFRFWYRFVFPNMSSIEFGLGEAVYEQGVEKNISVYMGLIFEEICKQYIIEQVKKNNAPFLPGKIDRWWGNNPKEKRQEEIDIMTFREDNALFGECKWTNAPVDIDVLTGLQAKGELFHYKNKWFWLFSKTGFTHRLNAEAGKQDNVRLISFDEMITLEGHEMDEKDQNLYVKETARKDQQYSVEKRYTYSDYAALDDNNRYELLDGAIYLMSPGPSQIHQEISTKLIAQLAMFLTGKSCKVFHAPFDVCLNAAGDNDTTVVQPDIVIVCDKSKLDGKRCNGAPDMVTEILSPSSASRDKLIKFNKYLQAGVREYWIVEPESKTIAVHVLKDGEYVSRYYSSSDTIPVHILEGCQIDMQEVFIDLWGE